ncbi:MAG: thioredoxin fold domain-containing protein [Candidatus Eisenbacteria bacterium]
MPPSSGGSSRVTPLWLLAMAGLLLAARVGVGVWDAANPGSRPEAVTWTAPSAAVEAARARGRLVLYAFTDRRNPASRELSSELFADAGMARQLDRTFVMVRIEGKPAADTPETAALRSRFKVKETPTLVVATPDGARSKLVTGFVTALSTLEQLTLAQMEMMDPPFQRRGGVRFPFGRPRGGAGDSSRSDGDSLRVP